MTSFLDGNSLTSDRRGTPRFLCGGTAELFLTPESAPVSASITNLSLTGCQLRLEPSPQTLNFKIMGEYEIAFCVNGEPFRVKAQLRSTHEQLMGMLFLQLSSRTKLRIQDLILELEQRAQLLRKAS